LAAQVCAPGNMTNRGVPAPRGAWRQGVLRQVTDPAIVGV